MKSADVDRAAFLLKAHRDLTEELEADKDKWKDEIDHDDPNDLPLCLRAENGRFMLASVALDGSGSNHNFAKVDRDLMLGAVEYLLSCITRELDALGVTIE